MTLSENLIIASLLVDIASSILIHFQIHTGMGKHIEYSRARPKMLIESMKVGLAQNTCYQALIGYVLHDTGEISCNNDKNFSLVKMSILAQFYQLASTGMQRQVVLWVGVFVFIFTLFTVFVSGAATDTKRCVLTSRSGCNLPMHSDECCMGP